MAYRLTFYFALILGFLLIPAPFSRSEEPARPALDAKDIEPLLRTDWYGLYLKDKKIGYFRTTRDRAGDFFRESETFSIKLASFGQRSEIIYNQLTIFENKPPYR